MRFISDIAENIRDRFGKKPVFHISVIAEDTFCYTNRGSYVRVVITFNGSGMASGGPRWQKMVTVRNDGLAL